MAARKAVLACLVLAVAAAHDNVTVDLDEGALVDDDNSSSVAEDEDPDYDILHRVNRIDHDAEGPHEVPVDYEDEGEAGGEAEDDDDYDYAESLSFLRYTEDEWSRFPLFVIILGGFRWDYLEAHRRNLTGFGYLRKHGSYMSLVEPVFPAEDYPVWTSIATGMYPQDHSITGDVMFNLKTRAFFNRSDPASRQEPDWWTRVDPFWSSAAKHGRKVVMFNWHDCTLVGKQLENPGDCQPYKRREGLQSRQQLAHNFNEAYTKLYRENYDLAVVYTDVIRRAAEVHGPLSMQMYRVLHDIDDALQARLTDIRTKEERSGLKANVIVMSDYGMTAASELEPIVLDEYVDTSLVQYVIYNSGYASIIPYALEHRKILKALKRMPPVVDVYLSTQSQNPPIHEAVQMPDSLRYSDGEWVQDILVVARPGFHLVFNSTDKKLVCALGPDRGQTLKAKIGMNAFAIEPRYPKVLKGGSKKQEVKTQIKRWKAFHKFKQDMYTLAFGLGPDFRKNHLEYKPVSVVDFYQIFCFLLRIDANPHSGSWRRVRGMLTVASAPTFSPVPVVVLVLTGLFVGLWHSRHL